MNQMRHDENVLLLCNNVWHDQMTMTKRATNGLK